MEYKEGNFRWLGFLNVLLGKKFFPALRVGKQGGGVLIKWITLIHEKYKYYEFYLMGHYSQHFPQCFLPQSHAEYGQADLLRLNTEVKGSIWLKIK